MNRLPPLLIVSPLTSASDLTQLPLTEAAKSKISVNPAKFQGMEMVEVIVDAMPFLLTRLTAAEARKIFTAEKCELIFCDPPSEYDTAIGIALGDDLISGKHLPEINRRLLSLGQWIGDSLGATAAAWLPARRVTSFAWFDEAVNQYLDGGPFPALFQASVSEVRRGYFITIGLDYLTGQEIHLITPDNYDLARVTRHLTRIIDSIFTHGKIVKPTRSEGLDESETLIYTPRTDLTEVHIEIQRAANPAQTN